MNRRNTPWLSILIPATLALAGCGGSTADPGGAGAGDPGLTKISGEIGPVHAPAGGEDTVCITKRLGNDTAGWVRSIRGQLSPGSHHMIVYLSSDTEEKLTPEHCGGFSGIFVTNGGIPGLDSANVPVFIAQEPDVTLQFPEENGVPIGFRVEQNQMVRIELHWFNTTGADKDVTGSVDFNVLPDNGKNQVIESSFAFWGDADLNIPPHSTTKTPVMFQRALAGTKSFAVTTHEHQLGTEMRIWHSDSTDVTGKDLLADGKDWAEPPLEMLDPPVEFGAGDGLAYQCEWNNTTNKTVTFGEGFNDEMCFLWAYYYPSMGFDICVHFQGGSSSGVCNHLVR